MIHSKSQASVISNSSQNDPFSFSSSNLTPRLNRTPRSSISPPCSSNNMTKSRKGNSSNSSLNEFYLPTRIESLKFQRSIFYEPSSELMATSASGKEGEKAKSMTKTDMWSSPAMSRTKMVLADGDKRVCFYQSIICFNYY